MQLQKLIFYMIYHVIDVKYYHVSLVFVSMYLHNQLFVLIVQVRRTKTMWQNLKFSHCTLRAVQREPSMYRSISWTMEHPKVPTSIHCTWIRTKTSTTHFGGFNVIGWWQHNDNQSGKKRNPVFSWYLLTKWPNLARLSHNVYHDGVFPYPANAPLISHSPTIHACCS